MANERIDEIKNIILENRRVSVAELSERFSVSFETIRRDLKILENEGIIKKTHGGAVFRERVSHVADYKSLENVLSSVKAQIASIATRFIVPNDSIYIDFSTTCLYLARSLGDLPLNVMTNSSEVLDTLGNKEQISLFSTGGCWNIKSRSFMGRFALENLSQFHFDKAFISCKGISMLDGLSDRNEREADLRQKAIECADEVYLLADHTKFDKTAFIRTTGFDHLTAVITDTPLSPEWQNFLMERSIKYYDCTSDFSESELSEED